MVRAVFSTSATLISANSTTSGDPIVDKKVTCPTCNKTLARKYSLDRHIARFHAAVQGSIVKSEQLEDLQEIPIVKSEQLGDLQEIPNIVKSDQRGDLQDFRDKGVQTSLRNECKERVL